MFGKVQSGRHQRQLRKVERTSRKDKKAGEECKGSME
jgi:hypothetical protein